MWLNRERVITIRPNSEEALRRGEKLHRRYGSWEAIRKRQQEMLNGE